MDIGRWLMHTHVGAWIRSIPSASFIPLWGIYLVVILAAALFLIWRKQVSAVRSLTQHMQKPVMTLQDLVAFSGLSPYHATALRVYEQYLKGTVCISPEDGYIHELNETDEDKEDEQTPMLYLRTHTVKIREISETNPRDRKYDRMLCAKNRKDFVDYQTAYRKKSCWFTICVIGISTVLIYLPALMRMSMGLARLCRRMGVDKLWTDRVVPIGRGREMADLTIRREDLPAYLDAIRCARGGVLTRLVHPGTEVSAGRALQFQCGGDCYVCGAGSDLVTVDEHGHIFPCRRMPIDCGSIHETTLTQVWQSHPVFIELRRRQIPQACLSCGSCYACQGGARCQAYAETESYLLPDPACGWCFSSVSAWPLCSRTADPNEVGETAVSSTLPRGF